MLLFSICFRKTSFLEIKGMKYLTFAFFAYNFFAIAVSHAKPIQVLLLDGQNNHNWKATTPVLIEALEAEDFSKITVSTSPPKKSPKDAWVKWRPDFKKYDAVLTNYNGEMWPDKIQKDLVTYVEDGGAFIVVHAANNAFSGWAEYNEMIGLGGWGGRSKNQVPIFILTIKVN